jgi:purine-binding chemotaxis protein CheW
MKNSQSAQDRATTHKQGTFLTFGLLDEEYGIAILDVKEIIGMMEITPIPKTPEFVKGVINLRGKVIPVIDLRLKFCLEPKAYDDRTCIIVVEVPGQQGIVALGLVVDAVNDVTHIKDEDVEEPPGFGIELDNKFILGMAKKGDSVTMLLDIAKVVGESELAELARAA